MKKRQTSVGILAVAVVLVLGAAYILIRLGERAERPPANLPAFSEAARSGQALFEAKCALCHGDYATGTEKGPPLIHPFYHPDDHGDEAIVAAVRNGIMAHHWEFGPMPPVPGITDQEISHLIAFIRELQRANGIG